MLYFKTLNQIQFCSFLSNWLVNFPHAQSCGAYITLQTHIIYLAFSPKLFSSFFLLVKRKYLINHVKCMNSTNKDQINLLWPNHHPKPDDSICSRAGEQSTTGRM